MFLLVLSMLAVESAGSIQLLYKHFLSKVTEKSLNAFYYACSYAKTDCCKFMNVTARLALQIIPEHLHNEPVFLCIDDTLIAKFGQKFENVSKLELAAGMVRAVMPEFRQKHQVLLLFDSWYAKKPLVCLMNM